MFGFHAIKNCEIGRKKQQRVQRFSSSHFQSLPADPMSPLERLRKQALGNLWSVFNCKRPQGVLIQLKIYEDGDAICKTPGMVGVKWRNRHALWSDIPQLQVPNRTLCAVGRPVIHWLTVVRTTKRDPTKEGRQKAWNCRVNGLETQW